MTADPATVRIPSGAARLEADLHRPEGGGPAPAVVMAHGFGSLRRARLPAYADRFRDAGFAVLVFDYRHFGGSGGEPRQLLSVRRQLDDWRAAVRYARGLPEVDPDRIALWGTSFSGGHVLRIGAEDDRVMAVVAQVPFVSGVRTVLALPVRSALKVTALAVADGARSAFGGRPVTVPAAGPEGTAAAMALDEADVGMGRLHEGLPWENRVCARIGPATLVYRPLRYAARVRCPLLVQVGTEDRLTPPGPAIRAAEAAPRGELRRHPIGHFDAYFGDAFEAMVAEQVEFLKTHASAGTRRGDAAVAPTNEE